VLGANPRMREESNSRVGKERKLLSSRQKKLNHRHWMRIQTKGKGGSGKTFSTTREVIG